MTQITRVYSEPSLAPSNIFFCYDWPSSLQCFWLYETAAKSALNNFQATKMSSVAILVLISSNLDWHMFSKMSTFLAKNFHHLYGRLKRTKITFYPKNSKHKKSKLKPHTPTMIFQLSIPHCCLSWVQHHKGNCLHEVLQELLYKRYGKRLK